ncbi:CCC motif membrane protein [Polaribacter porphyrae]|uniref:Uncharacterized protein n=1 Tax=Polaribacter porphyrae TaxID=1137780 RepID=A0A2S7WK38_9FLAO|nr:CCC motif membrane protein [Polaribacter porphyrae]PQJ77943.1 hypothetical protein BTO18_01525 [Polaribacter porphyrae]
MKKLNTTLIYVLSSLSILCCCFAGLGIILALPSFLIANKKMKEVEANPEDYDPEEITAMGNAKTFALVTLVINGLYFAYNAYYFATTDWSEIEQQIQEAMDKYQQ